MHLNGAAGMILFATSLANGMKYLKCRDSLDAPAPPGPASDHFWPIWPSSAPAKFLARFQDLPEFKMRSMLPVYSKK